MVEKDEVSIDKLIAMEWEEINTLKKMANDPSLSKLEKLRVSNAIGYHASVLDKLLAKKNEDSVFNEDTLGDFIVGRQSTNGRMRRAIGRDFRVWKRRLSSRR